MSKNLNFKIRNEMNVKVAVMNAGKFLQEHVDKPVIVQNLMTVVSELGVNILKYADTGIIRVNFIKNPNYNIIEIIAEDKGPGIENVSMALQERYSTKGTLGMGLPGIKRLVDELIVDSKVGKGTKITVRKKI